MPLARLFWLGLPLERRANGKPSQKSLSKNTDLPKLLLQTRIKNEIERGKILEARAKAETGELVNAEDVKKAAFTKARVIRDGLLNIPDRVSSVLASTNDQVRECKAYRLGVC